MIRERVDGIITATDAEVSRAMRVMMEKARLVVEPTGALGLAGAMKMRDEIAGKTVGVIVSGGNVDLDEIPRCWRSETRRERRRTVRVVRR